MTLVELLTGKKPFKKKFQKYKNTDDKVKICNAGQVEDEIEEKNIEAKLGKAKEEEFSRIPTIHKMKKDQR